MLLRVLLALYVYRVKHVGVCDASGAETCCCVPLQILYRNNHNAIATTMVLLYCLSHYLMGVIMYFEMVGPKKAPGWI